MPVFPQDPKINANANIITANSVDELPDPSTVKPNTVALIPSVAQSVYVYDSLDAAEAANLPEGSLVAVPSMGGGLPVVEFTDEEADIVLNGGTLTSTTSQILEEAYTKHLPITIIFPYGESRLISLANHVIYNTDNTDTNMKLGYCAPFMVSSIGANYHLMFTRNDDGTWNGELLTGGDGA